MKILAKLTKLLSKSNLCSDEEERGVLGVGESFFLGDDDEILGSMERVAEGDFTFMRARERSSSSLLVPLALLVELWLL